MSDAPKVLWVVGEPGVGKTTYCRRLFAAYGPASRVVDRPKWTEFGQELAAVGTWKGDKFDGGDTVPIGDIKPALLWYADHYRDRPLTVFDGDKFANDNAVAFVLAAQPRVELMCVAIVGTSAAAAGRDTRGTHQNLSWVAGRRTKSARFADRFPGLVITINRDSAITTMKEQHRVEISS